MHWIYLIHEFHNLSWITEINELFHDILIYWDAPVISDDIWHIDSSYCFKGFQSFYIDVFTLKDHIIWRNYAVKNLTIHLI